MTYAEICLLVQAGDFDDSEGNWSFPDSELAQLDSGQILTLRNIAVRQNAYFEGLAEQQEAAERKGKTYKLPPGVPDIALRGMANQYQKFLEKASEGVSVAEKAFKAPGLANKWLPMISDFVYKDGKTTILLNRIFMAANGMRTQIEEIILCRLGDSDYKSLLSKEYCPSGISTCEAELSDVNEAMFYGYLTAHGYRNLPKITGDLDAQANQYMLKIMKELFTFPFQVATALMTCGGNKQTYKSALNQIEKDICSGVKEVAFNRTGSTPFTPKNLDPGSTVFDWIVLSSTINGSLYSYFRGFIDSFKAGGVF